MLLDVGTGSGEIAYYLSDYFRVISIDINDQRLFHDGFEFLVTSEVLPFASNVFDIVISNHVIEHVNSTHTHISEIHRVLKPEGWLYLATPNRLWPWEVHYRVPLIHYLPRDFFHWLMRKAGKYQEDIDLQTSWQLEFNCRKYFLISSVSENICQNPRYYKLNVSERLNQALNVVPKSIIKVAHCLMPTLIYMMQKKNAKKILWLTSSYPRFEDDSASVFLRYLAKSLCRPDFELHVMAPDHSLVALFSRDECVWLHHFRYSIPRSWQKLAYGSGILPNLRASPSLLFQVPFFLIFQFFSTWQLIRRIRPDLIHAHWIIPQGAIGVLLGKLTGVPVIVTAHGGDAFALHGSLLAKIKHWTIKNCRTWTSNTLATAKAVGDELPQPVIIPMGIDCQHFGAGRSVKKSPDTFVLLFVGRLVEKKGVLDLIVAFSLLPETLRNKTELWIVGDGAERKTLETQAHSLGIADRIIFFGRLPNAQLPDYYASADIFIAPSIADALGDTEGQGVILLEAMASETAVISTKTGGISEIVNHGKSGILLNPAQPEALKQAIEQLLNDSELRAALAREGKHSVQAYDWKIIGSRFSALYDQNL